MDSFVLSIFSATPYGITGTTIINNQNTLLTTALEVESMDNEDIKQVMKQLSKGLLLMEEEEEKK